MFDLRGAVVRAESPGFAVIERPGFIHPRYLRLLPGVSPWDYGRSTRVPANLLPARRGADVEIPQCPKSGLILRAYQQEAVRFALALDGLAVVGLDVGLGKTVVALMVHWLRNHGTPSTPFLIVGPLISAGAWVGPEADPAVHFGLRVAQLRTRDAAAYTAKHHADLAGADGYFINHEILPAWQMQLSGYGCRTVIVDESHLLRGGKTDAAVAFRALVRAAGVRTRLALSATPVVNKVADLWAQLDFVQPEGFGYWTDFVVRYCHAAGTRVLMGDFTERPIEQVRVGDEVIGFDDQRTGGQRRLRRVKVTAIFRHEAPLWLARLATGNFLLCTESHQWYVRNQSDRALNNNRHDYLALNAPRLIKPRVQRLAFLPKTQTVQSLPLDYIKGWLRGVMDGDGHIRSHGGNKYGAGYECTLTQAEKNKVVIDRAAEFAGILGWRATVRHNVKAAQYEVHFAARARKSHRVYWSARECYNFFKQEFPWPVEGNSPFYRGWIGGIYDAEGSSTTISQHERVNPETCARIGDVLRKNAFAVSEVREKRHDNTIVGWQLTGGREACVRFLRWARPARYRSLDKRLLRNLRLDPVPVMSFEPTGDVRGTVYNIQTESGNYFANGFASKNCGAHANAYTRYALGDETNVEELRQRLDRALIRRSRFQVRKELPAFERQLVALSPRDLDADLIKRYRQLEADFKSAGAPTDFRGLTLQQMTAMSNVLAEAKRPFAAAEAESLAYSQGAVVVFTWFKETAAHVADALRLAGVETYGPVDSGTTKAKRDKAAEAFKAAVLAERKRGARARKAPLAFVATIGCAGMSMNQLAVSPCALCCELYWVPATLLQMEGRIHREGQLAEACFVRYLYVRGTLDELMLKHLQNKARAVERVTDDPEALSLCEALGGAKPEGDLKELCKALIEKLNKHEDEGTGENL